MVRVVGVGGMEAWVRGWDKPGRGNKGAKNPSSLPPTPRQYVGEQLPMEGPGDSPGAGGALWLDLGQHGLPARCSFCTPPLISTPAEESGTSQHRCPTRQLSRHCWVLAEQLYACKVVHGLEPSQGRKLQLCFRSPCAQRQASPSPGRDTTSDSA